MEIASQLYSLKGATLLMDREFEGITWLKYLHQNNIRFVLRLKKGVYKNMINQQGTIRYSKLHHIAASGRRLGQSKVKLPYATYQFIVMKNPANCPDEPFLYFLSSLKGALQVPDKYLRKWKIEICFKHLKSNGLNLEGMHFKDLEKIELMMAIAAISFQLKSSKINPNHISFSGTAL